MITSNAAQVEAKSLAGQRAAEYFQELLAGIRLQAGPHGILGVTSCRSGEGVSTIATNLAIVAAATGRQRVLLAEARWRRPSLARRFRIAPEPGLGELLRSQCEAPQAIRSTDWAQLSVLPAGLGLAQSESLIDGSAARGVLADLRSHCDLLVLDLPPLEEAGAALPLADLVDDLLLVVEAERLPVEVLRRARLQLGQVRSRLAGAILNKRP